MQIAPVRMHTHTLHNSIFFFFGLYFFYILYTVSYLIFHWYWEFLTSRILYVYGIANSSHTDTNASYVLY